MDDGGVGVLLMVTSAGLFGGDDDDDDDLGCAVAGAGAGGLGGGDECRSSSKSIQEPPYEFQGLGDQAIDEIS